MVGEKEENTENTLKLLPSLKTHKFILDQVKKHSLSEMYNEAKLSKEALINLKGEKDKKIETLIDEKSKLVEDKEKEEETKNNIKTAYLNIQDLLRKYLDIQEEYYTIIPLWIIGTYIHSEFPTYPFLYFNAMRGSGKTRLMKLINFLACDSQMLNSLTEAVLFRTKGTLCIDEFEGITRKGSETLRELLNSAYKKGTKVKRMKKQRTLQGEEQVVEEFDVYRPIVMANIWGIEEVLSDRCIPLILERSSKSSVVSLVELFEFEELGKTSRHLLYEEKCRLCRVVTCFEVYRDWNEYVYMVTNNNTSTQLHNNTKRHYFKELLEMGLDGRSLELTFPLIIIADFLGEEVRQETLKILKNIMTERKEDFSLESRDITFIDFVAQCTYEGFFVPVVKITHDFKAFLQEDETEDRWINSKWIGRAIKRLKLSKFQKRNNRGREVVLDIEKAKEKMRMFR